MTNSHPETRYTNPTFRGIGLIILAMLAFATMDGISRFLVRTYSIGQMLWVRYMVFLIFALWLCRKNGMQKTIRSSRPWLQVLRAVVLLVEGALFLASFMYFPLAETHAIAASTPLIVTALAPTLLKEHVGLHRWIAVLVGFAGTLIIVRPVFATTPWTVIWPLLAALGFATLQIMTRMVGRTDKGETTLLYTAIVGFFIMSTVGPRYWSSAPIGDLALMVAIGVLASVAHFLLILAFRYAQASVLQPYTYFLLVWAVVVGLIAFREPPDSATIAGGAIVVASGLYGFHRERLAVAQHEGG